MGEKYMKMKIPRTQKQQKKTGNSGLQKRVCPGAFI
jgi:hypothetical protein